MPRKYALPARSMREYRAWISMKVRCENPRRPEWERYGGRGITIAPEWRHSFQQFLDDMGPCPPRWTLDRIDNDGPYAPGNCRWANYQTQNRNSRNTRLITAQGVTRSIVEWAEHIGIPASRLHNRLRRGWSIDRALNPTREIPRRGPDRLPRSRRKS